MWKDIALHSRGQDAAGCAGSHADHLCARVCFHAHQCGGLTASGRELGSEHQIGRVGVHIGQIMELESLREYLMIYILSKLSDKDVCWASNIFAIGFILKIQGCKWLSNFRETLVNRAISPVFADF
jgi:hypothetical protein